MQVRAATKGLRIQEVPVSYRKRTGHSKITGTLRGTVLAGWAIITTILCHARYLPWRVSLKRWTTLSKAP